MPEVKKEQKDQESTTTTSKNVEKEAVTIDGRLAEMESEAIELPTASVVTKKETVPMPTVKEAVKTAEAPKAEKKPEQKELLTEALSSDGETKSPKVLVALVAGVLIGALITSVIL